jgi:uncharacterized membrane protein
VRDDPWQSIDRRRLVVVTTTFAGVFLLGGIVGAIEFLELRSSQAPAAAPEVVRSSINSPELRIDFDAKFREARSRVADTRRTADAAEVAVFQFLNQEFVERADQLERPVRAPSAEPPRVAARPAARPNPEWLRLKAELASLQVKRGELLEKMTLAHPAVQALNGQIGELEDQLAAIPADLPLELDPNAGANSGAQSAEASDGKILNSENTANVETNKPSPIELQQTYRALLLAAGHARDSYRKALNGENLAVTEWVSVQNTQFAANDGTIHLPEREPVSLDSTPFERTVPIGAIVILALISLIAASTAARRFRPRKLTYISADEIEAALGLPTLGQIGTRSDKQGKNAA